MVLRIIRLHVFNLLVLTQEHLCLAGKNDGLEMSPFRRVEKRALAAAIQLATD